MANAVANRLVQGVHDLFFRTVHGSSLIYNTCWEDPRIDRQLLRLTSESKIVMLTSAGCNALDYLLDGPAVIYAVDMNPRQNALLDLKLALIQHGSHADLFAMFGVGVHWEHQTLYRAIRPRLNQSARQYWDDHIRFFDPQGVRGSFYYYGAAGTVAWLFSRYLLRTKGHIRAQLWLLINAPTLGEQKRIYEGIEPVLWDRFACWALRQPVLMSMLGVPRTQMDMTGELYHNGLLDYVKRCLRHVFTHVPLADNYFWRVYLTGSYTPTCCPNYLKPEHLESLRTRARRIQLHTSTVTEFLRRHPGRYTHFVLLDHQDWLANHNQQALVEEWEQILRNSQPGAKILFRSAGATLDFLPNEVKAALRFHAEQCEPLHQMDRVGTYRSLYLAEVV
jgi:S-adenosylmethionine-diacylglycerol 3-amino-3-carboxypropyl transferase